MDKKELLAKLAALKTSFEKTKKEKAFPEVLSEKTVKKEASVGGEEANAKVKAAIETLTAASDMKEFFASVKGTLEAKAKFEKASKDGNAKVAGEAKVALEGYAKASASFKGITEGIQVLIDAGLVAKASFELTAEAQKKLGPVAVKLSASLKGYAEASVKATGKATLFSLKDLTLIDASGEVSAKAEAKITGKTELTIDIAKIVKVNTTLAAEAFAKAEASAKGTLKISKDGVAIGGKVTAIAKAGGKATGSADITSKKGVKLAGLTVSAEGGTGVGGEIGGKFELVNGVLKVSVDLGAALGIGGSVGLEGEINIKAIAEAIADEIMIKGKSASEWFKEIIDDIEAKVKKEAQALFNALKKEVDDYSKKVQAAGDNVSKELKAQWENAKKQFDGFVSGVEKVGYEINSKVAEAYDKVKKGIRETALEIEQKASSIADDIADTAKSVAKKVDKAVDVAVDDIKGAFKKASSFIKGIFD